MPQKLARIVVRVTSATVRRRFFRLEKSPGPLETEKLLASQVYERRFPIPKAAGSAPREQRRNKQ
jgi:hypothetical protein